MHGVRKEEQKAEHIRCSINAGRRQRYRHRHASSRSMYEHYVDYLLIMPWSCIKYQGPAATGPRMGIQSPGEIKTRVNEKVR